MSDDKAQGVVEISSVPAAGSEPAHVSVFIDGDRRFTVRTSDLENIGAQLRGKKSFSFFNSIVVPAAVVLATTLIAQLFQYISWRNSTVLQQNTERSALAKTAYHQASDAISKRFYATKLYLDAAIALNRKDAAADKLHDIELKFNQGNIDHYNEQMKIWNDTYDQILSDIDFYMDRPILWASERVSAKNFEKLDCGRNAMLLSELQRLKLNVRSLKVQFGAIDYCLKKAMLDFDIEVNRAVTIKDYAIPESEKKAAAQRVEDVRSMSNEFRCFAQHRVAMFEEQKRKSIFKLSRWLSDRLSALFVNPTDATGAALNAALDECDYTKPLKGRGRFAT